MIVTFSISFGTDEIMLTATLAECVAADGQDLHPNMTRQAKAIQAAPDLDVRARRCHDLGGGSTRHILQDRRAREIGGDTEEHPEHEGYRDGVRQDLGRCLLIAFCKADRHQVRSCRSNKPGLSELLSPVDRISGRRDDMQPCSSGTAAAS